MTLQERLGSIKMLVLDVDGVLTDGRVWISSSGEETISFNVRDGLGITMLIRAGVDVALLSGRKSRAAVQRAKALGIETVKVGKKDKLKWLKKIARDAGVELENIAYVGDDLADLEPIKAVGLPVAVADAVAEIRAAAHITLEKPGGHGAVRELAEKILAAKSS